MESTGDRIRTSHHRESSRRVSDLCLADSSCYSLTLENGHDRAFREQSRRHFATQAVTKRCAVKTNNITIKMRFGFLVNAPARMLHTIFEGRTITLLVVA